MSRRNERDAAEEGCAARKLDLPERARARTISGDADGLVLNLEACSQMFIEPQRRGMPPEVADHTG